jgi:hypothetical protein
VANAVQACREKDVGRLSALIAGTPDDAAIAAMFARGNDVRLLTQSVPDTAERTVSIDVTLEVDRTGGIETAERTWELVKEGDGWLLTAIPDCY